MSIDQTIARVTAYESLIEAMQDELATELTAVKTALDPSDALTLTAPDSDGYYVVSGEDKAARMNLPHKVAICVYPTAPRVKDSHPTGNGTNYRARTRLPISVMGVIKTEAGDNVFDRPWKSGLETKERDLFLVEILGAAIVQTIEKYATTKTGIIEAILIDDHPDLDFTRGGLTLTAWCRSRWEIRQKIIKPNPR